MIFADYIEIFRVLIFGQHFNSPEIYGNKKPKHEFRLFNIWLIADELFIGLTKLYSLNSNLKTFSKRFDTDNFSILFTIHS